MSNPEFHTCCTCGYSWRHGHDGSHSCSKYMAETIATLKQERDAAYKTAMLHRRERDKCAAQVEVMREALEIVAESGICNGPYALNEKCHKAVYEALSITKSAALREQLEDAQTRLAGQTCFVPPEFQAELNEWKQRAEAAEAECLEQARLNGMGGERELDLMTKLSDAQKSIEWWMKAAECTKVHLDKAREAGRKEAVQGCIVAIEESQPPETTPWNCVEAIRSKMAKIAAAPNPER